MRKTVIARITRPFALAAMLAAVPLLGASPVHAAPPAPVPAAEKGGAVKTPGTPEEQLAKAEEYRKKAAAYRAEAAGHRKMLADFVGQAKTERADEDPDRKAMRVHCEGYINKAEALATEAENFAAFHRMRADELRAASGAPPASASVPPRAQTPMLAIKLALTPQDNLARAEEYKGKAASARAEAAAHRKMLEQYKQDFPATEGQVEESSYVKKMRLHCEGYITKAEALATEAERFADFHRARAAELQGK